MPEAVAFTLFASLAAMGDVAVGERRGGFDRPARSAVLGLVAAALGIARDDGAGHAALDASYLLALRVLAHGDLLRDYHTVQAPPARRNARWATRRAALDRPRRELQTLISLRDYRTAPAVDVALIVRPGASPEISPARIAEALRRPAFTLFFGRKACPLALPPGALACDCPSLGDIFAALDANRTEPAWQVLHRLHAAPETATVFADLDLTERGGSGLDMLRPAYRLRRIERRRDRALDRRRWQFELRDEAVAEPEGADR
jgi:CRISPR system Cascade subunit CasD